MNLKIIIIKDRIKNKSDNKINSYITRLEQIEKYLKKINQKFLKKKISTYLKNVIIKNNYFINNVNKYNSKLLIRIQKKYNNNIKKDLISTTRLLISILHNKYNNYDDNDN